MTKDWAAFWKEQYNKIAEDNYILEEIGKEDMAILKEKGSIPCPDPNIQQRMEVKRQEFRRKNTNQ